MKKGDKSWGGQVSEIASKEFERMKLEVSEEVM